MSLTLQGWESPDRGVLFVVTGSSGTGKTTLLKEALRVIPGLRFSVSATTRPARPGEVEGVDYRFVSERAFDDLVRGGELLEWASVYGHRYGTPRGPVLQALRRGLSIVLEIDVQGARQVRERLPGAVSIFVLPPDLAAIERRLRSRSTDSEQVIRGRVDAAMEQIAACGEFDYLLVNADLPTAHDVFQAILVAELCRAGRRSSLVERFVRPPRC